MRRISYTAAIVISALTLLWLSGCCSFRTIRMLDQAKALAQKEAYATLAQLETACDPSCDGCGQLHLIKGDACFRLAKQGEDPEKYYPCASLELGEGIRLTRQRDFQEIGLNRSRVFINLLESLRNQRDMLTGAKADAVNEEVLKRAHAFLSEAPEDPCGIYFEINARYARQRKCLLDPSSCATLCSQLQEMLTRVEKGLSFSGESSCVSGLAQQKKEIFQARRIVHCP